MNLRPRKKPDRFSSGTDIRLFSIVVAAFALIGAGCDDETAPQPPALRADAALSLELESDAGGFFNSEALTEDAVELGDGFAAVKCEGATTEEAAADYHPRMVRGQVMAPMGRLASRTPRLLEWIVPSAHAVPLELEQPVADATVSVSRIDARGVRAGDRLVSASTDPLGRYCVRLPDDVPFGPDLVAEASRGDIRLRRFLPNQLDGNISAQNEAVTRLVLERIESFEDVSTAEIINLQTIADTSMDFLSPAKMTPDDDVDSTVRRIREKLLADPRFQQKLEGLTE